MHRKKKRQLPRWRVQERTVIRLTASSEGEAWIYQYPPGEWRAAVKRIMQDTRDGKIPDIAAGGLLEMIAGGVDDDC